MAHLVHLSIFDSTVSLKVCNFSSSVPFLNTDHTLNDLSSHLKSLL